MAVPSKDRKASSSAAPDTEPTFLTRDELLKVTELTVLLDPEMAGWELTVVIGLRIQKGRLIEIQEKIAKDPRVYGVYDVTGDFDSMVISRARDRSDLDDLSKNVMSVDGVERSVTHLVLNTVKETSTVLPE